MINKTQFSQKSLYNQDYQLWLETTSEQLRNGQYSQIANVDQLLDENWFPPMN